MVDLLKSRDEIDKIDRKITELFQKRMSIANDVAEYKLQTGKKILDKEREHQKLDTLKKLANSDFNEHGITELFTQIMSISRKWQYGLISNAESNIVMKEIESLETSENTKVVCFGDKGSYTEQAMESYFTDSKEVLYAKTFRSIMEMIKNGEADYGVLPIENSSTGSLSDIYDLLVEYDNCIVGETVVKIEHALVGLQGAKKEELDTIYSHGQGILQCSKYLSQYPNMEPIVSVSTADSVIRVLNEKNIKRAAIASEKAAEYYGLEVLERKINHEENNATRFIIITKNQHYIASAKKISICFEVPHISGSLYGILSHFIYNNLSMTKIESRPIEGRTFEYRFFVDFEGNLKDAGVINALYGIGEEAVKLKILGNY